MFWNKRITSDEYTDLSSKIVKLNNEVLILQATVEKMEMRVKSYHTKLARIKDEETDEQQEPVSLADIQRGLMGLQ